MINRVRLALVAAACFAALCAGAIGPLLSASPPAPVVAGALETLDIVGSNDVTVLVRRLTQTGIFPAARSLAAEEEETSSAAASGPDEGAVTMQEAADRPPILAIVRRDGVWRIFTEASVIERQQLMDGDILYDGWTVSGIAADRVTLARGEETLEINVFEIRTEG